MRSFFDLINFYKYQDNIHIIFFFKKREKECKTKNVDCRPFWESKGGPIEENICRFNKKKMKFIHCAGQSLQSCKYYVRLFSLHICIVYQTKYLMRYAEAKR